MAIASHLEMHREHLKWRAEDDLWRDELAAWEAEVSQTVRDLPKLEAALREHTESLRKHAASIRLYEQEFALHEHALAQYERGESGEDLVQLAKIFSRGAEKHAGERHQHENVKRLHHDLMVRWRLLTASLLPAEPCQQRRLVKS